MALVKFKHKQNQMNAAHIKHTAICNFLAGTANKVAGLSLIHTSKLPTVGDQFYWQYICQVYKYFKMLQSNESFYQEERHIQALQSMEEAFYIKQ